MSATKLGAPHPASTGRESVSPQPAGGSVAGPPRSRTSNTGGNPLDRDATDGGFRPDGAFVPWPARDTAALTEAFRRAVLRLFVRRGLFESEDAHAMLAWPHSGFHVPGFHVHDAVLVPDGDVAFALRLARYCARNSVALERLEYDAQGPQGRQVRYRSDKPDGPTAGTEAVDPLEFLARVTAHIPNKHQVLTRYYGYYANRVRDARRRWAELLRQIFEVDPLRSPQCGAEIADRRGHYRARRDRPDPRPSAPRPRHRARTTPHLSPPGPHTNRPRPVRGVAEPPPAASVDARRRRGRIGCAGASPARPRQAPLHHSLAGTPRPRAYRVLAARPTRSAAVPGAYPADAIRTLLPTPTSARR